MAVDIKKSLSDWANAPWKGLFAFNIKHLPLPKANAGRLWAITLDNWANAPIKGALP